MSLDIYERRGNRISQKETDLKDLTAKKIIDKIRSFWERLNRDTSQDKDIAPIDFLELLEAYPFSMCSYHMTDSLKLLVALMYFDSRHKEENPIPSDWEGYSMDYLALIFDRSKKTIYDAIKEKETEAKAILEEAKLRKKAREIALKELIEEEKRKIKSAKRND